MTQQNFSNYINLNTNMTTLANWTSSLPQWVTQTQWSSPTHWVSPTISSQWVSASQWFSSPISSESSSPSNSDMAPYALYYFVSGAMFFLGTAYMLLSSSRNRGFAEIDGISTMSDFTKTRIMKYMNEKPNRELIALISSNGMKPEEFINILSKKRAIH